MRYAACWERIGSISRCVLCGKEWQGCVSAGVRAPAAMPAPRPFRVVCDVSWDDGEEDDGLRRNSAAAILPYSRYQPVTSLPFLQHWWMNLWLEY